MIINLSLQDLSNPLDFSEDQFDTTKEHDNFLFSAISNTSITCGGGSCSGGGGGGGGGAGCGG